MIARFRRWLLGRRALGPRGEDVAARYLKKQGYRVLARNLRNRCGEIDILAREPGDAHTLIVVEVKAGVVAPGTRSMPPELHVNRDKQRKLVALSAQLLRSRRLTAHRVRYDVIAVEFPASAPAPGSKPIIRHHRGAFESHV